MNNYPSKPRFQPSYTITNAKQDIEHLSTCVNGLETTVKLLRDEVDCLRNDEWRSLHLCQMAFRRLNILEALLLELVKPEGQQYLTHRVMTVLRNEKGGAV